MKVAIIQMTSVLDFRENLKKIETFLKEIDGKEVGAVFLPECFYSMSNGRGATPYLVEFENEHYENIRALSTKYKVALLGGTAATLVDGKVINRAYNFSAQGEDLGHYDKNHLFSCDFVRDGNRKKINEGDVYTPGTESKLLEFDSMKIGLGVCFDLRYSEMSLAYRMSGAQILTFSSAFTIPTGKAHWHTLLRARAIESQCFVIASAQWGENNEIISTYGHSLIVDPWGEVLVDAKEGEGIFIQKIDFKKISEVRSQVIMGR
ncbi:nitrilase-related carbon-nitrogen hydrolase [Halobacteriovorax sp. JY17]|uniref:nitrilase-related carbon-nitrogen hydrolase n=1 Tax=Halobacteriovorax sp. JY17 TaxID=2014617 RepID=UPI000C5D3B8E|nr:nitrilase-related carbon-nitrogen hydrolase [Halobacteriovorax sp. JY17]PIK13877.1 MAG: amidohydrolase [Halobacteriovorax sp. JY17]